MELHIIPGHGLCTNFSWRSGQYANVCIPDVSPLQFHPFSLMPLHPLVAKDLETQTSSSSKRTARKSIDDNGPFSILVEVSQPGRWTREVVAATNKWVAENTNASEQTQPQGMLKEKIREVAEMAAAEAVRFSTPRRSNPSSTSHITPQSHETIPLDSSSRKRSLSRLPVKAGSFRVWDSNGRVPCRIDGPMGALTLPTLFTGDDSTNLIRQFAGVLLFGTGTGIAPLLSHLDAVTMAVLQNRTSTDTTSVPLATGVPEKSRQASASQKPQIIRAPQAVELLWIVRSAALLRSQLPRLCQYAARYYSRNRCGLPCFLFFSRVCVESRICRRRDVFVSLVLGSQKTVREFRCRRKDEL